MKLFLYGPPASGKSTYAKLLGAQLGLPVFDADKEIVRIAGKEISEIFADSGETAFRTIEADVIRKLIAGPPAVISLGGGALLNPSVRKDVEAAGCVVCLKADAEVLEQRSASRPGSRPLLNRRPIRELLAERQQHYASFARQADINLNNKTANAIAVQAAFGIYRVSGMGGNYQVIVESGALGRLREFTEPLAIGKHTAVVCDGNTRRYAETVAAQLGAAIIEIEAGEEHKTIDAVMRIWQGFLKAGIERSDTVFAVGGGIVGDLTGFAAATWLRGVYWVNIPTTLLAMVDSSLGGKTGADLPQAKNLIGAFHPPSLVLSDPDVLKTLPERELRCGTAETIKHAVIDDPELFDLLRTGANPAQPDLIARSLSVKVRTICADPYEKGIRAALNFGHTIGHAVETVSGFTVQHGEAVAIGLAAETQLAVRDGIASVQTLEGLLEVLVRYGLPTEIPASYNREELLAALMLDKKKSAGTVKFAVPERIGSVKTGVVFAPPYFG